MTLILSLITDKFAMQVADRRLIHADGPKKGELFDDDVNKLVCLCGNSCFSYTGLAFIGKLKTDKWIVDVLARSSCRHPAPACNAISDAAGGALRFYPRDIRRQAFVAVGWSKFAETEGLRPFVCRMSNALDANGVWMTGAEDKFVNRLHVLSSGERLFLTDTGVPLGAERKTRLRRLLSRAVSKGVAPNTVLQILVDTVLDVARTDARVGMNLLCVCIPKDAVPDINGGFLIVANSPNYHQITFKYFNPAIERFIQYGPDFVCGGGGWTNFRARILRSRPKAITARMTDTESGN